MHRSPTVNGGVFDIINLEPEELLVDINEINRNPRSPLKIEMSP
jgi:hypothetical protein